MTEMTANVILLSFSVLGDNKLDRKGWTNHW